MKQTERLKNENKALKEIVRLRDKTIEEKKNELATAYGGIYETSKILHAYIAYITHKCGGDLKIKKNEVNELLDKYVYTFSNDGEYISFKEKERKKAN